METTTGKPLGLAIAGCGRISESHLKAAAAIPDRVQVLAVVDPVEEKARARAGQFGIATVYTSIEQALSDQRIEAVGVWTQPVFHVPLGVQIAQAKRHVVIEKPLCLSVAEADRLIRAGAENGVVVMSGQSRRFNDLVFAAKRLIEAGEIGRLLHISVTTGAQTEGPPIAWWGDPALTGPNALLANWASHWVDQIVYLAGRKPLRVYAEAADHHPKYAGEDEWSMLIRFEDDLIASYTHSFNYSFGAASGFAYAGTRGVINIAGKEVWLNGKKVEGVGTETNNFRAEYVEFAAAIRQGRPPLCAAAEVRPVIAILEGALLSAREHRAVDLAVL
jgi:predicted dehydrogenase